MEPASSFPRAYDFGYSFDVGETLDKWGKEEILKDVVRVIRTFRPEVITTLPRTGNRRWTTPSSGRPDC